MVPCLTHLAIAATFVHFAQSAPGKIPVPKTGLSAPGPPRHTPFLLGGLRSQAWSFSFDNTIGSDCEGMHVEAMAELETYGLFFFFNSFLEIVSQIWQFGNKDL